MKNITYYIGRSLKRNVFPAIVAATATVLWIALWTVFGKILTSITDSVGVYVLIAIFCILCGSAGVIGIGYATMSYFNDLMMED